MRCEARNLAWSVLVAGAGIVRCSHSCCYVVRAVFKFSRGDLMLATSKLGSQPPLAPSCAPAAVLAAGFFADPGIRMADAGCVAVRSLAVGGRGFRGR